MYDYNNLSNEVLFQRYCKGDAKAFDTLLERLQGLVYSLILRYFKDETIADEIFQEVFFKVCKNKDQFRESVSFKSWLVTICKNTCIDYTRKKSRQFYTTSLDNAAEDNRPLTEVVPSEDETPDEILEIQLENEELTELLDQLPIAQRETFYLKVIMEMTFEEIGKAMDCSTNTAKSRYRYALNQLRALVKRKQLLQKTGTE